MKQPFEVMILYQVKCFVCQLPSDLNSAHQPISENWGQPMVYLLVTNKESFDSDVNHEKEKIL